MIATTRRIDEQIARLKAKPYRRELVPEDDGSWFVAIAELPGCISVGKTPQDAFEMIDAAMDEWLRVKLEDGDSVPKPFAEQQFSGRFIVRVGKSLHRELVSGAQRDGVSLNHFVTTSLSKSLRL